MTTIGMQTARRAAVSVSATPNQIVRTGNGIIKVSSGRARSLQVGSIVRSDFGMHVAGDDELNVLGMNFLSSLRRWGVEGRWLVLVP
jgi:aspartyl protease family protein